MTIVDTMLVITVVATDASATEGGDTGAFTFSRTGPTTEALTVFFTRGGTATLFTDYSLSPSLSSATFAVGESTATTTVTALTDAPIHPNETVIVTLTGGGPYAIGSPSVATVTIVESVTPTLTVGSTDTIVVHNNGPSAANNVVLTDT